MDGSDPTQVRNLRFPLEGAVPRHWHGGRRSVTAFFDNLSIFFPEGERFFVQSVNAHRAHVKDPRLQQAVRIFAGQEGVHSREHVRYNELLQSQGYPIAEMEARVTRLLGRVKRRVPMRWQLAATCALEHFTSLLGHMVLDEPEVLAGAHPTMAQLWRWHAAEECEHKEVAFDVFLAAGGTWPERSFIMAATSVIFWGKVAEHQVRLMHTDGTLLSVEEWVGLLRYLFVEPGSLTRLLPRYLDYYRPGFHPRDVDSRGLVQAWRDAAAKLYPGLVEPA
jgi:predicted metal-dependent hydrolase